MAPSVVHTIRPDDHQGAADELNGRDAWYAVWTHSNCERLVAGQMCAKRFQCFLPEINAWSKQRGASPKLTRVPMFPGYFFVRHAMDRHSYVEILKVRRIVRILGEGWSRLTPVPDIEIEALQQIVDANVPIFAHQHLRHGDRVRVIDGPMTDLEGFFVRDRPHKGRLVVSVDLLGRSVAVEIDGTAVRSCPS